MSDEIHEPLRSIYHLEKPRAIKRVKAGGRKIGCITDVMKNCGSL